MILGLEPSKVVPESVLLISFVENSATFSLVFYFSVVFKILRYVDIWKLLLENCLALVYMYYLKESVN